MAIIAKNIVVAGQEKAPATTQNKVTLTSDQFKKILTNEPETVVATVKVVEKPAKYIKKIDGELVRQINTKSEYLRDMYLIDSE